MQERERKPPIDLNPPPQYQSYGPQPGPISYITPPPQKSSGGNPVVTILLAAILASVVALFAVFQLAPSKGAVSEVSGTVAKLESRLDTLSSETEKLQTTVTGLLASQTEFARKSDIEALKSEIAQLKMSLTLLKEEISSNSGGGASGGSSSGSSPLSFSLDKDQVISTSTDTGNKDISLTVKNNSGESKQVSLLVELRPLSPAVYDRNKIGSSGTGIGPSGFPQARSTLTGWTSPTNAAIQTHPDMSSLVARVYWISPEFSLGSGSTKSIWLNFDVLSTDVVTWQVSVRSL